MTDDAHSHTWIADGESWMETDHHDSCNYPDAETSHERAKALQICQCKKYRVRRYTCHCGKMKEVEYR